MTQENRPLLARYKAQLGIAALLVAAGVAIEFAGRREAPQPRRRVAFLPPSPEDPGGQASLTRPLQDARHAEAPGATAASAAGGSAGAEPAEEAAIADFLKLLGGETRDPGSRAVALALTEEFNREPALKKAHQDFLKLPPARRKPKEFLARVGEMPQFKALVNRFVSSPGIGSLLPAFAGARARDAREVAREWAGKARGSPEPPRGSARGAAPVLARAGPTLRGGPTQVDLGGGGMQRAVGGHDSHSGAPMIRGGPSPGAHGAQAGRTSQDAGGGGIGAGKDAGGREGGVATGAPGKGEHDVTGLDKEFGKDLNASLKADEFQCLSGARECPNEYKHFQALLRAMKKEDRDAIVRAFYDGKAADAWGACFVTGRFNLCKEYCRRLGTCDAAFVATTYWQACLSDGLRDSPECIRSCVDLEKDPKGGCAVDPGVWEAECAEKSVDCEFCSSSFAYGKPKWISAGKDAQGNPTGYWEAPPPGCHDSAPAGPATAGPTGTPGSGKPPPASGDPTDIEGGWSWDKWVEHNELRHALIMGSDQTKPPTPPDEAKSMAEVNLLLRYSPADDYMLNIMSGWNRGVDPGKAGDNLILLANRYGPTMPYLAAAAWLEVAKIRAAGGRRAEADALFNKVAKLAGDNPKLADYKQLAEEGKKASRQEP